MRENFSIRLISIN